jgi:hypothetical protein
MKIEITTRITLEIRTLIVRQLGAALADAWRRQRESQHQPDADVGIHEKDLAGAEDTDQARL